MKIRPVTIIILLCSIIASIFYINHQAGVTTIHSVDMVTYDSATKKMCILDSGKWNCYDIFGSYTYPTPPPIDWGWFKKGYVPQEYYTYWIY